MASKMSMSSRFSVNAASGVGVAPTPQVQGSRPSVDSSDSRPCLDSTRSRRGDSFQSRTDSSRSRQHLLHPLPQVLEGDGIPEQDKQNGDSHEFNCTLSMFLSFKGGFSKITKYLGPPTGFHSVSSAIYVHVC